jgi:hypothetical protein
LARLVRTGQSSIHSITSSISTHLQRTFNCCRYGTLKREFVDHLVSRSTYLLDIALRGPQTQALLSIAEAAAWLEVATTLDEKLDQAPSMKKNLGLAYMTIVRSKENHLPIVEDIFGVINNNETKYLWVGPNDEDWKAWATNQWQRSWSQFLEMNSARDEPDYDGEKQTYESVMKKSSIAKKTH